MSGKRSTGVNVGGSSILVIFILLCLTTFATLSLVSANADLKLTQRSATAVQEYYAADTRANETLAAVHTLLADLAEQYPESRDFVAACMSGGLLPAGESIAVEQMGGDLLIRYVEPMGHELQLAIELRVVPGAGHYELTPTAWQVQSTSDWQPGSQGLDLWNGEDWLEEPSPGL